MRYFSILILFLLADFLSAQGFRSRNFLHGVYSSSSKGIYETTPGNYFGMGIINDTIDGHSSNRLCVVGLNNHGQIVWTKKYGNYKFEYLDNLFVTRWLYKKNSFIYHFGGARDSNNKYIGILIKFNFNGDSLWQRIYRDSVEDIMFQAVSASFDNGFIITGFSQNNITGAVPTLLIKTDANGNELWRKKYHKTGNDFSNGRAILQDTLTKKIIIAGEQSMYNQSIQDASSYDQVLILDSVGTFTSRHSYLSTGGVFTDMVQSRDKKIVVAGARTYTHDAFNSAFNRSYALSFDINYPSLPTWTIEYTGRSPDSGINSLVELANQDLILGAGIDTASLHNKPDNSIVNLMRLDKNGQNIANNYYSYNYFSNDTNYWNDQGMRSLNVTSDGGLIAAIQDDSGNHNPLLFIKYDSLGCDSSLAYCASLATSTKKVLPANNEIKIYPNPCDNFINIDFENKLPNDLNIRAVFINICGFEEKRAKLSNSKNNFEVKDIEDGLYLVKVLGDEDRLMYQYKLLKQSN